MNNTFLLIPVFLPIILGIISFLIPFKNQKALNAFIGVSLVLSSASVWYSAIFSPENPLILLTFTDTLDFSLKLDGAGKIFACLSATLWPLTALYAFDYMKHEKHLRMFYCFFTMSFGATMGIAMSANMLTMYLFYELLTLFTIPLVMHGMERKHKRAARKYMVYSIGGAAFAFAGVVFLIVNGANTFTWGGHITTLTDPTLAIILFIFAFMGFGVKSAIFPLHSWLPTASVAPTPVTALLHAVAVVKAGAFAVIRLIYYSYGTDFLKDTIAQYLVMAICIFTIVYGSVSALKQPHFKRRLAYSTISNLSYIAFAATLMTKAGLIAAFCHLIFHSVIKIGAFFCAGSVLHNSKKEYIQNLEGIGRKMPITFTFFTVFALALTGIPPLCGFFSKWYIAVASLQQNSTLAIFGVVALLISALLTAIYMISPTIKAFFPSQKSNEDFREAKEANWKMLVPIGICGLLCILMGIFAQVPINLIEGVLGI
ncbi:MAG: proton-conducting membrane transporter [Clostridia bacterium]|nr:proton-conducting membrane transporter [Clostridia bacterium]